MNNLLKETVLVRLKESTGLQQLFYGLLFVVCLFFVGGTVYTILTTIRLMATLNPLPGALLIFTAVYVLMQASLAYGFYTARLWIAYALLSHTTLIIFTAFVLLPLFGLNGYAHNTLLGGIPFGVLGCLTYAKRTWLYSANVFLPTLLYTLLICFSLALSVMIYVYTPA